MTVPLSDPGWVEFGRQLRARRRAAGLTQAQVGLNVGYHHTLISKLESGLREPSPDLLRRLDELLMTQGALSTMVTGRRPSPDMCRPPELTPVLFPTIPGDDALDIPRPARGQIWPARLPFAGIACALHGSVGCDVPTLADALTVFTGLRGKGRPIPAAPDPDLVHSLCALLAGMALASDEEGGAELAISAERMLHLVIRWARTSYAQGISPDPQLRLASGYAQVAGRLRLQRGQNSMSAAWFTHALQWAQASNDVPTGASLLTDMCTLARLDRDPQSALNYARALQASDPQRGWVATLGYVNQARAYALRGDATECQRGVTMARRRLTRLDERDRLEAPWLEGAAGELRVESAVGGALRDLAVRTGDVATARRAVNATKRSLANLPSSMRPGYVLLTLRLADGYALGGDPSTAVAVATPVLEESALSERSLVVHELAGLRRRLRRWDGGTDVRALEERLLAVR